VRLSAAPPDITKKERLNRSFFFILAIYTLKKLCYNSLVIKNKFSKDIKMNFYKDFTNIARKITPFRACYEWQEHNTCGTQGI